MPTRTETPELLSHVNSLVQRALGPKYTVRCEAVLETMSHEFILICEDCGRVIASDPFRPIDVERVPLLAIVERLLSLFVESALGHTCHQGRMHARVMEYPHIRGLPRSIGEASGAVSIIETRDPDRMVMRDNLHRLHDRDRLSDEELVLAKKTMEEEMEKHEKEETIKAKRKGKRLIRIGG